MVFYLNFFYVFCSWWVHLVYQLILYLQHWRKTNMVIKKRRWFISPTQVKNIIAFGVVF